MPRTAAAPQAPSLVDEVTEVFGGEIVSEQPSEQAVAQSEPEVYVAENPPEEKTIVTRKDFTILVGRVISRNYQTVKYEESIQFTLDGGTAEAKRAAYERVRDSIIARVCSTADAIALGEKL